MTRARAIELLKGVQFCCDLDDCTNAWDCDECVDAFNMAIEALEQEPCDDCISRKDAIDEMGYCQTYLFDTRDKDKKISLEDALYALEQLPSAQPKRGKWGHYLKEGLKWKCSECGSRYTIPWSYCPNCGARMETEQ